MSKVISACPLSNRGKKKEEVRRDYLDRIKITLRQNLLICNYISLAIVVIIGVSGWRYLFIYLPMYALFLLWLHWEQYLLGLDMVETSIWGRPLNYYKETGEPRPKVKFVWSKKTMEQKQNKEVSEKHLTDKQRKTLIYIALAGVVLIVALFVYRIL